MMYSPAAYLDVAQHVLDVHCDPWARSASIGMLEPDSDGGGGLRVSVYRRPSRGRGPFYGWARFEGHELAFLDLPELLELVEQRLVAALARIGVSPMKRTTRWIRGRWSVTAVHVA